MRKQRTRCHETQTRVAISPLRPHTELGHRIPRVLGPREDNFCFSFFSFLINAKPLDKTFMTRQREIRHFLLNHSSASGLGVLTSFLSSSSFSPNILTVLFPSFPLSSYSISHCPYTMHRTGPHNQDLSHLKCQMYNAKEGKGGELLKQQD